MVEGFRPPVGPPVPLLSSYPETNVRTYVIGPDGRDGIHFLGIDADSAVTSGVARAALSVPYHWSSMSVTVDPNDESTVRYSSRRRGRTDIGHELTIRFGQPLEATDLDGLPGWPAGRWRAFTSSRGATLAVPIAHEPWPLVHAEVLRLEESLLLACGLPVPRDAPLVFGSPGVDARIGWPHRTAPAAGRSTAPSAAA
jgi:hypothetical protein